MDLLGMLKDQVSGTLAGQASKFLGESEGAVSKALGGVFPALLNSTIDSAEDEKGAGKIMDLLKGMDTNGMDDIAGIFSGGASGVSKLMNQGSGIMNLLMGNKTGGMIDSIAKFAGLRGSSASSLIKMAAPFLMKMIGKQVMGKGTSGLMSFLSGQKESARSALPAGFAASFLDGVGDKASGAVDAGRKVVTGTAGAVTGTAGAAAGAIGHTAGAVADSGKKVVSGATDAVGNVADAGAKAGGSILRYLIPIFLVLLGLGFLGKQQGCGTGIDAVDNLADKTMSATESVVGGAADMAGDAAGAVGDAAGAVGDAVGDAAGAVGDAAGNVAGSISDMASSTFGNINASAKAALDKVSFTAGSAGSQMMDFIDGGFKGEGEFTFKGLTFASGSDVIDGKTAVEIDNVAKILNTYPDVKVEVTGYTDSSGDAAKNIELSKKRADAVKTRLVSQGGIAANRIMTKGLGSANPVGDNSTPEGMAMNRRIVMKIVK